eukprot:533336_1
MSFELIVLSLLAYKVSSQCKWQFGSNVLDLTPLQNVTVEAEDDQGHTYFYSICRNEAGSCNDGDPLMTRQIANSDAGLCYEIGRWNPDIRPTYDEYYFAWEFEYNGGLCIPSLNRSWAPTFICNPNVELLWGTVTELFGSCRYQLQLQTRYACSDWTTTTEAPNDECIWKANDGYNTLNISSIYGKALSAADNDNNDLFYTYTPCSNSVKCDNTYAMIYLFNISAIQCEKYLAIWENGMTEPSYNNELGIWQFVYNNGEQCDSLDNTLVVQWVCDQDAEISKIVKATESIKCDYELVINSSLACG